MKKLICKVFGHFLYRGMKVLYKRDERVKAEVDAIRGSAFAIKFDPRSDACIVIDMAGEKLAKRKVIRSDDIVITFKTLSLAFKVMTGQKGLSASYAEHDFTLDGSINLCMGFVRAVELTMAHLLPKFMLKKILREVPERKISMLRTYFLALFGA